MPAMMAAVFWTDTIRALASPTAVPGAVRVSCLVAVFCLSGCGVAQQEHDINSQAAKCPADTRCWLVTNRSLHDSPSLELAVADLQRTLAWALRVDPGQVHVCEQPDGHEAVVVSVCTSAELPASTAASPPDGYRIQSSGTNRTTVVAGSVTALVTGLYRLAERLRIDRQALFTVNEDASPAFRYRLLSATSSIYKYDEVPDRDEELDAIFQRAVASGYPA